MRKELLQVLSIAIIPMGFIACGDVALPDDHQVEGQCYAMTFALNDSTQAVIYAEGNPDSLVVQNNGEDIALIKTGEGKYRIPVFDGVIRGAWSADQVFQGEWIDKMSDPFRQISLTIEPTNSPLLPIETTEAIETIYGLNFEPEGGPVWQGQLVLQEDDNRCSATIRTGTGDLRYLGGTASAESIELTTFDGAHLYKFDIQRDGDDLTGYFHSHTGYKSSIQGKRLGRMPVTDPMRIQATGPMSFTVVTDQDSTVATWTGDDFKGNVTIIDLMGTWCPNCMDAARMIKELQEEFPNLQVASVAFETRSNPRAVFSRFETYKADLGIAWPMVYGGPAKKKETGYKMNFLTGFESFPTTLILDKAGNIAYVHTGFNGPATGDAHTREQQFFRAAIRSLMN
jgi:thiol-disulfide isomerase/thioredoxin